jgi:hypothetical protein
MIVDIPIVQWHLTILKKGRSGEPKRHPWGPITSKKQSTLNPQTEKQLNAGRVGRMIHSSTLLIPYP